MMTKSNPKQGRCKLTQVAAHMRPPISLLNAVTDAPFPTATDGCEEFVLGEPGQTCRPCRQKRLALLACLPCCGWTRLASQTANTLEWS